MAGKQPEFPGKQGHAKSFEHAMLLLSVAMIVFVVICIEVVAGGSLPG